MSNGHLENASSDEQEPNGSHSIRAKLKLCNELKEALEGSIGDIVSKHEEMILQYYQDVQMQARQSFDSAKKISKVGFGVLISTLIYTLIFDALAHFKLDIFTASPKNTMTVGGIGLVSGLLIEFIAGINFWLYARAAKQFNAFHICLERTHRYLIAYKIGEQIEGNRDEILGKLICIMANAPMITARNINNFSQASPEANHAEVKATISKVEEI